MAVTKITYGTKTAITITLASLATDTNLLVGRESAQIDNSSDLFDDAWLQGKITVGTTPTTAKQILVYVWGSDSTGAGIDTLDGTDSACTFTSAAIRNHSVRLADAIDVDSATSDRPYYLAGTSIASLFGGIMPKFWGLWVVHNTATNLNATGGNHVFNYTGITYTTV